MKALRDYAGYIDVEIHVKRTATRDAILAEAVAKLGARRPWWRRTRVTNLVGGQFSVRFYA
jgi:hypothetical protein